MLCMSTVSLISSAFDRISCLAYKYYTVDRKVTRACVRSTNVRFTNVRLYLFGIEPVDKTAATVQ